jgi:spore maturation protein CgeB
LRANSRDRGRDQLCQDTAKSCADLSSVGLSILYLGPERGTCLDRANALRRLGHRIEHVDLRKLLPRTAWVYPIIHKLGGHLLSPWILHSLPAALQGAHYDLCYVDGGELVTPRVIRLLRNYARKVINYNIDDPLGNRDGAKSKAYRRSLASYDLCVVMRPVNVSEAHSLGAKHVMHVYRSSDEVTHAPRVITQKDRDQWNADVLFLGTWFPERGPFLLELVNRGVPLTIRGSNWRKAPEWPTLRSYWKGGPLEGDEYAKAIQCAKVNLGLLSTENRDLHTTRSMEIPALGGLLCAERTVEHLHLYIEGKEALFWSGVEECAAACTRILTNEELRKQIAAAGQARSVANGNTNENVMRAIVQRVCAES